MSKGQQLAYNEQRDCILQQMSWKSDEGHMTKGFCRLTEGFLQSKQGNMDQKEE